MVIDQENLQKKESDFYLKWQLTNRCFYIFTFLPFVACLTDRCKKIFINYMVIDQRNLNKKLSDIYLKKQLINGHFYIFIFLPFVACVTDIQTIYRICECIMYMRRICTENVANRWKDICNIRVASLQYIYSSNQ